jgi:hypothetical protein
MLMSMRRDIKATAQHLLTVSFAIADTSTGSNFCLVNCVPLASLLYCDDRKNNDRHLFVDVDPMNSNHWIWGDFWKRANSGQTGSLLPRFSQSQRAAGVGQERK